ncbi:hypothetical protein [Paraburkholderia caffeinilytica]|uniref:hypothetical protein n=1 Tax=Paraburkholderia caffeinilytica TaxID=1761016 RepID=UPI003DA0F09C
MSILKKSLAICLFLFGMSAMANELPEKISVINNGKVVTSFEVPVSSKIEISAEQQETNAEKTRVYFRGKARLLLNFPSGGGVEINADEIDIFSEAKAIEKSEKQSFKTLRVQSVVALW